MGSSPMCMYEFQEFPLFRSLIFLKKYLLLFDKIRNSDILVFCKNLGLN